MSECTLMDNNTEIVCKNLANLQTSCTLIVLQKESKPQIEVKYLQDGHGEIRGKFKGKDMFKMNDRVLTI